MSSSQIVPEMLGLWCGGFAILMLGYMLALRPLRPPPRKFKLKSRRGFVHVSSAVGFLLPAAVIILSPFVQSPAENLMVWQSSVAAWLIATVFICVRRFEIPTPVRIFSIPYFILVTINYLGFDDGWLLTVSAASAISAGFATVLLTLEGIRGIRSHRDMPRNTPGDGRPEANEDAPLLPKSVDGLDEGSEGQEATLPPGTDKATGWSLLTFSYMDKIIKIGEERQVEQSDLPHPSAPLTADEVGRKIFATEWTAERKNPNPSLAKVLFKVFGVELLSSGALKIGNDLCNFVQPLLLQEIIVFSSVYRSGEVKLWYGIWLTIGLTLSFLVQSASFNQYFNAVNIVALRTRAALMWVVFDKSCKLSSEGRAEYSSGAVQNLMANDARRLSDLTQFINYLWSGIFQIVVSFALLWRLVGPIPTISGLVLCLVNAPVHGQLMTVIRSAREMALKFTDERVKVLSEIFSSMKVVKLYAWEDCFIERVRKIRDKELLWVRRALLYSAFSFTFISTLPVVLSTVAIGTYALIEKGLRPEVIFPAIALLNVLRAPLLFLPNVLVSIAQAKASITRLEAFLGADELVPRKPNATLQKKFAEGVDIVAQNATFAWDKAISQVVAPNISKVDFEAKAGELCMIVGVTGSGKTSLLAGLLNEAFTVRGVCGIRPDARIAYVDQTAFIFNATVRDNVLFGAPYDPERYQQAIRCTALEHDLDLLPAGDSTEIGGRGVNLSGGQRQRVSLARAVYADADVYLLDDPLSAVDAAVGKKIFNESVAGVLKGKTRLFVTNQIHLLQSPEVSKILLLNNGVVVEQGTYDELMRRDSVLAALMKSHGGNDADMDVIQSPAEQEAEREEEEEKEAPPTVEMKVPVAKKTKASGVLVNVEARQVGQVKLREYTEYVKSFGGWKVAGLVFVMLIIAQVVTMGSNFWLSIWSSSGIQPDPGFTTYMLVYVFFGLSSVLITGVSLVTLALLATRASRYMHETMLLHILGAPMSWFDSTPIGRLLNRFNSDIDRVDSTLVQALLSFIRQLLALIAILGLIIFVIPVFIVPLLATGYLYFRLQEYYRKTSVDLRRLESVARSPLYNHFTETLDGLVTLRAYKQIWRAKKLNEQMIDLNTVVSFANLCANRWLSTRLELSSTVLIFFATLFAVVYSKSLEPAFTGLMLSYALQLTASMTWLIRQFTEAESQMSAVERVLEYCSSDAVPQEETYQLKARQRRPKKGWPRQGKIEFRHVSMRYRPGLPLVLDDVSFVVQRGEKIGICGRTGAGKSSLLNVLFRLNPLASGTVLIDDTDTGKIPFSELRGALSIIPQEPLIFSGTFRTNLDPFNERSDDELWHTLHVCGLKEVVTATGRGLDAPVAENGSNLSVDVETDHAMQETLKTEFKDCTTLTIAHRLETVIHYDKIMVLDRGRVVEFDTPAELLDDPSSAFSSLVSELGPAMSARLRDLASGKDTEEGGVFETTSNGSNKKPERGNRQEVVRRSFLEIRNAIINHDAVDWREELSKTSMPSGEWKTQLASMSEKLFTLSTTYLRPPKKIASYQQVYKMVGGSQGGQSADTETPTVTIPTELDRTWCEEDNETPSISTAGSLPKGNSVMAFGHNGISLSPPFRNQDLDQAPTGSTSKMARHRSYSMSPPSFVRAESSSTRLVSALTSEAASTSLKNGLNPAPADNIEPLRSEAVFQSADNGYSFQSQKPSVLTQRNS